jgi:serine/threonine protein kinase
MSNAPKDSHPRSRYQIVREVGRNQEGVRITYLAKDNSTQQPVILTRFVLNPSGSTGANYEAHQPQIQLLRQLHHPGILRYLDSFPTADGFCLVQQYKQIQPLTVARDWTLEQIKHIAISVLEILIYLQNQVPPILHRNINLETIFLDAEMKVYLMDFSCAQIGGSDMPLSRIIIKKFGFVPPELLRNRPASEASDLYSLGVILMSLLTRTESEKINTLIDLEGNINVKGLVPKDLSFGLVDWLETMVSSNPKLRYPNAIAALEAIKPVDVKRLPEIKFIPDKLEFKANKFGEIISQSVTIINPITDTVLSGSWDVASLNSELHSSVGSPAWISFEPANVKGDKTVCQISVDTGKLMTDKTYERQLLLQANSAKKTHLFPIKIQTVAIQPQKMLFVSLALLLVISFVGGWFGTVVVNITPDGMNWSVLMVGLAVGSIGGWGAAFSKIDLLVKAVGLIVGISGVAMFLPVLGADLDIVVGFFVGLVVAAVTGMVVKHHQEKKFSKIFALSISVLAAILGMSLGIALTLKSLNTLLMFAILGTGIPLAIMILKPYWQYLQLMRKYKKSEGLLIKP